MTTGSPNLSTNLGIGNLPEVDEFKYPSIYRDLARVHAAIQGLQYSLDRYTGNISYDSSLQPQLSATETVRLGRISKLYVIASAALTPGQLVNFVNGAGVLNARLADMNAPGRPSRGICTSPAAVAIGQLAEVTLFGEVGGFAGLAPGTLYYTGATGAFTTIAPTLPDLFQPVAYALSQTAMFFDPVMA